MVRLFVERKAGFQNEAKKIHAEIKNFLGIQTVERVRFVNRYDIENISEADAKKAATQIFSEVQSDECFFETLPTDENEIAIAWEFLPGQFDQRSDSAEQCLSLLFAKQKCEKSSENETKKMRVKCAKLVLLSGKVTDAEIEKIKSYLINPVDSRLAKNEKPATLFLHADEAPDIPVIENFISLKKNELENLRIEMSLAMDALDLEFLQRYFQDEKRNPTETELRVLDTYWSDHCRHTTFLTELEKIEIEDGECKALFEKSLENYKAMHREIYANREKKLTLMDIATIGAKYLRAHGKLSDLEISDENNACSIYIDVHYTRDENGNEISPTSNEATEKWLLMFKNETHNHPTEIEPFGGAATCIGGAIRDPLSGRAYVYQAMRITGASDPREKIENTMQGKLPQLKLCREAARGFSSYGNQIGLATGQVVEMYHEGYKAKRLECGAVVAAAPVENVFRGTPEAGDAVLLLGGGTGRDGIGGATGSSKAHTKKSVTTAGAEVQKGNAVEERKLQRLFRNPDASKIIVRSNDFGAGGVSVAIGELAEGLEINLDAVPKKYEGLNGTELAISESQERMAVVLRKSDVEKFIERANAENINAVEVARVTNEKRLRMTWRGKTIVDLSRTLLDSAGAPHHADALIVQPASLATSPLVVLPENLQKKNSLTEKWLTNISSLSCCSERGLSEMFDSTIGAGSVLFPFGGTYQATSECGMVAKIPSLKKETSTVSVMSFGFDARISEWSAWHGAQIAVLSSLAKIASLGGNVKNARFSFQEYFGKTSDEKSWGYPLAALLGALDAQAKTGCAAIGGKDSMSGSFENVRVPHTLISFAVVSEEAEHIRSGAFQKAGSAVYAVIAPYGEKLEPNFASFMKNTAALYRNIPHVRASYAVGAGGIAEALSKMCFGNRIGIRITDIPVACAKTALKKNATADESDFFLPQYGSLIIEADEAFPAADFIPGTCTKIGETIADAKIIFDSKKNPYGELSLIEVQNAWETPLADVFPIYASAEQKNDLPEFAKVLHSSISKNANKKFACNFSNPQKKVRVFIPVFPGTNCEYDMERAFRIAGADVHTLVFRNRNENDLQFSLEKMYAEINEAEIFSLAGGFSLGDEPDGSGKYIANVIREKRIRDAIMDLLKKRNGLVLGICNGFQALVKTGLLPFGEICEMKSDMPTLTFNTIGRHISRVVRTKIISSTSEWANDESLQNGKIHFVPISHGEGRIVMNENLAKKLFEEGQVFSQYVDENGNATMLEPDNPNGSSFAIEGLTSSDGHVLGKMGHSERTIGFEKNGASKDLLKNVGVQAAENIFASGVRYFS